MFLFQNVEVLNMKTLLETTGTFYMLQACIQGILFIKPRKFNELRVVKRVQLHCIFYNCNLIWKQIRLHYRHDHFVSTLCFLNYSSDVITASHTAHCT